MIDHTVHNRVRHLLMLLVVLSATVGLFVQVAPLNAEDGRSDTVVPEIGNTMTALAQKGAQVSINPQTGRVNFIGTPLARPTLIPASASREQAARGFLAVYGGVFGLRDAQSDLRPMRVKETTRGRGVVRFQQLYASLPVFGGELMVQLDSKNNLISANGELLPPSNISTTPAILAPAARESALQLVSKWHNTTPAALEITTPALWVYNPLLVTGEKGETRLVWRLEVKSISLEPIWEIILIDAQRGHVVLHFNQIAHALNRRTYTANNNSNPAALPGTLVCQDPAICDPAVDLEVYRAHLYAGSTYDYYNTMFGRDSIDGFGMPIISTVRFGFQYKNAFWEGTQMVYGDGYGFARADDVVGHELTHGVIQYEANLFYYYQAGTINESLADVFGEFVDLTNSYGNDNSSVRWLVGEDVSGYGALRSMSNPPAYGNPDRMLSPLYDFDPYGQDNGGVHSNSGINNKAVYLMVDGGSFNGKTVTALGIDKTARIYYEVMTNMLTSGSDYGDLYTALYQSCVNMIGLSGITSADCQEVRDATDAVQMNSQPSANYNTDAPLCPTGLTLARTLFYDDLESGTGNWAFESQMGSSRWSLNSTYWGPNARSGLNSLYADDYIENGDATTSSSARMTSNVSLPVGTTAYLHFAHTYGFEYIGSSNYDGGIVEYSTNNGLTWNDADAFFQVNGYKGTISTGSASFPSTNPLAGRRGFINDSHGYISSRATLASQAGQNIRFRWRMGLDGSFASYGWWVDDVRVYTCAPLPPVNDSFASARVASPLPFTVTHTNVLTTTVEPDETFPSCRLDMGHTLWYSYTPTQDGRLAIDTLGSSDDYDTVIGVWTGSSLGNLLERACNDDYVGTKAFINMAVTANTTYYIQVGALGEVGTSLTVTITAPPVNDQFENPIVFAGAPYTNTQTTLSSTRQLAEQTPSCNADFGSSVWYEFTAASSGELVISTEGSTFANVLSVWTGSTLGGLTEIGCHKNYFSHNAALVILNAVAGTTYSIQVSSLSSTAPGGTLQLRVVVPPPNDSFVNATSVASLPFTTSQSSINASIQPSEPLPTHCPLMRSSVWYRYTAAASQTIVISTAGSNYDTVVAVWAGGSLPTLAGLVCNDNDADSTSLLTLNAVASATYYIQVGSYNSAAGSLLNVSIAQAVPPANDDFANAVSIAALPYDSTQTNVGATLQGGEQTSSCGLNLQSSVWYSYTPAVSGLVALTTQNSSFNTIINVWTGSSLGALSAVACNDNNAGLTSQVVINASAATTYYIQVGGLAGDSGSGASGSVLRLRVVVPPANDGFASALPINALPYFNTQSNVGTWTEAGEPFSVCGRAVRSTVWYKYTAPVSKLVTFKTVNPNFDTVVSVWTGTAVNALTMMPNGCTDGPGLHAVVNINTVATKTYYIMVSGIDGIGGDFGFQAYLNNDFFSNAIPMDSLVLSLPYTKTQSTLEGNVEVGERVSTCGAAVGNTVWYKFTAPLTAAVQFDTTGSDFNTVLSVWSGTTLPTLVQLACNDDGSSPPTSTLLVNVTVGRIYYLRIGGTGGASGTLILNGDIKPPVTIAPPRNLFTVANPTLSWNRITWATAYEIQVDESAAFTAPLVFSAVLSGSTLSVEVPPLARGQYYFRVRARNSAGVWGAWSVVDTFLIDVP